MRDGTPTGDAIVETEIVYGLVEKSSGRRIGLSRTENVGEGCYNDESYSFAPPGDGRPPYAARTAEEVVRALDEDTPWYNSTKGRPGWGGYRPLDLALVRVVTVRTTEPLPFPPRDVPYLPSRFAMDVRRRDVAELDPDLAAMLPNRRYRFQVACGTAGTPDLAEVAGKVVDFDRYGSMRFRVVAVLPAPDEFVGNGRPGDGEPALFVCLQDGGPSPIPPYSTLHASPSPKP